MRLLHCTRVPPPADVTEVSAGELSTLRLAALYYPRPASSITRN